MNAEDRIREAATLLATASDDPELSEIQSQTANNLAGICQALAESIDVLRDDPELIPDGGTQSQILQTGVRMIDSDNSDPNAAVWVVDVLEETIDEHVVYETDDGTEETVYDYHRGDYDADEQVVRCVFLESVYETFPQLGPYDEDGGLTVTALLETLRDLGIQSVQTDHGRLTVYAYPRGRLDFWGGDDAE